LIGFLSELYWLIDFLSEIYRFAIDWFSL
jgi:hypothetical protein